MVNLAFLFLIDLTFNLSVPAYGYLGFFLATIILANLFVRIFIQRFILRKIKIIYKIINSSQILGAGSAESPLSDENTFEGIEEEVAGWAKSTQNEINSLKSLETYRKNYVGNDDLCQRV